MLARIPDRTRCSFRIGTLAVCAAFTLTLTSCATKQEPPLISDTGNTRESAIPWDKQEKWESQGQYGALGGNITDRR